MTTRHYVRITLRHDTIDNPDDRAVKQTIKHGGGSLMLWRCMTSRGVGDLQKVDGRLNAKDYILILHGDLYLS